MWLSEIFTTITGLRRSIVARRLGLATLAAGMLLVPAHAQQVDALHEFTTGADGLIVNGGVMKAANGVMFGVAGAGGLTDCEGDNWGCGTIYRFTVDGHFKTIHNFNGPDGKGPSLPAEDRHGYLWGTTFMGGANGYGVIYRMSQTGKMKVELSFAGGLDGGYPVGPMLLGTDDNFYGMTAIGGANGCGTLFRLVPPDQLMTLAPLPCGYGGATDGGLTQGADGSLYAMTGGGSPGCNAGCGAILRFTPDGVLSILDVFDGVTNGANGGGMRLVRGEDANFYGLTSGDGTAIFAGSAFRITPDGAMTVLISNFWGTPDPWPTTSLIHAPQGTFYSASSHGGDEGEGSLFKMTMSGELTTLVSFTGYTMGPIGSIVIGKDGKIYFTSPYGAGLLARVTLPAP